MQKLNISKKSFWDVDFDNLDVEKYSLFVMQRVLEYGFLEDLQEIIQYYGEERIRKEIVNASWLNKKTLHFCCLIFNLKQEDFKCYAKKQLNPTHWDY